MPNEPPPRVTVMGVAQAPLSTQPGQAGAAAPPGRWCDWSAAGRPRLIASACAGRGRGGGQRQQADRSHVHCRRAGGQAEVGYRGGDSGPAPPRGGHDGALSLPLSTHAAPLQYSARAELQPRSAGRWPRAAGRCARCCLGIPLERRRHDGAQHQRAGAELVRIVVGRHGAGRAGVKASPPRPGGELPVSSRAVAQRHGSGEAGGATVIGQPPGRPRRAVTVAVKGLAGIAA
jgi:hypothetical protein